MPDTTLAADRADTRRGFFPAMGLVLLLIVLLAFGPTLYLRPFFPVFPIPGYLYLHGVLMTIWFLLLPTQAFLIRTRRVALHRSVGIAGLFVAAALVVTAAFVVLNFMKRLAQLGFAPAAAIERFHAAGVVIGDLFVIVLFVAFVGGAWFWRRQPAVHARCMVFANIMMMGPPLTSGRWLGAWILSKAPWLGLGTLVSVLLAAVFAYDLITRRRLHWMTVAGTAASVAAFFCTDMLVESEAGRAFVISLAGAG